MVLKRLILLNMDINGITMREIPLEPAGVEARQRAREVAQLAVFGTERLAEASDSPPSDIAIRGLMGEVEELCNDGQSRHFYGKALRTLRGSGQDVDLTWNPAGIIGGFSPEPGWDDAPMTVNGLIHETYWAKPEGAVVPRRYKTAENMFISRHTGTPMVTKAVWRTSGTNKALVATKPASASEIANTHNAIRRMAAAEKVTAALRAHLPLYVEIGFGLDPMALRGARTYQRKNCVEIDNATGSYVNRFGNYADAVESQAVLFAQGAARERAGQHISFLLGDGGKLPLPDTSVHELFMSNVLNANIHDAGRHAILCEAQRVIKKNGTVVVRANWHTDEWPQDRTVRMLRHYFYVPRSVSSGNVAYQHLDNQYGRPAEVAAPDGYCVLASPR